MSILPGLLNCGGNNEMNDDTVIISDPDQVKTLQCTPQTEQTDYDIFKMASDGYRIGDLMPYYDVSTNTFCVFYLKDIWDDATSKRHPWYGFETTDFYSYNDIGAGEIIGCSTNGCDQDFAIGTGSVIKNGSTYYGFYTGHNPNYPSSCVTTKEGVMLATSSSPTDSFVKNTTFNTIYAPSGTQFDEQDNFRDPFVFEEGGTYYMLISARANVNGTWRGVIAKYTSADLLSWGYDGILYDGDADIYFMMETSEIFKIGNIYYLVFSDSDSRRVNYRKSTSVNGPWEKPVGSEYLDGNDFYAAKTVADGSNTFIMGFNSVHEFNTDSGARKWGGNLVAHKLIQKSNGDLCLSIPSAIESNMHTNIALTKNRESGLVTKLDNSTESYQLSGTDNTAIADVIYEPIAAQRYLINTTVSYTDASGDFGFFLGACDEHDNVFSLRFVPAQNKLRFDKTKRSLLNSSTIADNEVELALIPNTDYDIKIVIENSVLVIYVNNEVAMSSRIYKASNTSWGIFAYQSSVTFNQIKVSEP